MRSKIYVVSLTQSVTPPPPPPPPSHPTKGLDTKGKWRGRGRLKKNEDNKYMNGMCKVLAWMTEHVFECFDSWLNSTTHSIPLGHWSRTMVYIYLSPQYSLLTFVSRCTHFPLKTADSRKYFPISLLFWKTVINDMLWKFHKCMQPFKAISCGKEHQ